MKDLNSILFNFIEKKQRKHILKEVIKEIKNKKESGDDHYLENSLMNDLN